MKYLIFILFSSSVMAQAFFDFYCHSRINPGEIVTITEMNRHAGVDRCENCDEEFKERMRQVQFDRVCFHIVEYMEWRKENE